MRHYTACEAAAVVGLPLSTLRTWEIRYGWPQPVRKANGYRLYSEATLALVRDFIDAGRPIHQLIDGEWRRTADPTMRGIQRVAVTPSDDLERKWICALSLRQYSTIAEYLASLGRMRPAVRAQYVRSAREADRLTGGAYRHLLRRYGIEETEKESA